MAGSRIPSVADAIRGDDGANTAVADGKSVDSHTERVTPGFLDALLNRGWSCWLGHLHLVIESAAETFPPFEIRGLSLVVP